MNIDKWLVKAILAVKPSMCAAEYSQILLVAEQTKSCQRGFCHCDGLDRLLIVERFFLSARVPIAVANRPEEVFDGGLAVQEVKRCFRYIAEILLWPAASRNEQSVWQHGVRVGHARLKPGPVRPL